MILFEYLIKLLMGNSDTLFVGLIIVIFGYYGWLLKNINDCFKKFCDKWDKHEHCLQDIKYRIDQLDESVYRDLGSKLDSYLVDQEKLSLYLTRSGEDLERCRGDIIEEVKESSAEIKEIMKILLNHRLRSYAIDKDALHKNNPEPQNKEKANKGDQDE